MLVGYERGIAEAVQAAATKDTIASLSGTWYVRSAYATSSDERIWLIVLQQANNVVVGYFLPCECSAMFVSRVAILKVRTFREFCFVRSVAVLQQ